MTFVSLLEFRAAPGRGDDVVRGYGEQRIFETCAGRGGLRSARLLRPLDEGEAFVVVAEWDDAQSYRAWLADPERARVNAPLAPLLDGESRGGLYELARAWPA